jgi:ornithine cyclodeaminase/alanine dehydrogenase-like protein (mu-crystallin family)
VLAFHNLGSLWEKNEHERGVGASSMGILTCTDVEIESLLDTGQLIAEIRAAFAEGFANVRMPQRIQVELVQETLLIMPCGKSGDRMCGVKMVTVSSQDRPGGRVKAFYLVLDSTSGDTIAFFDANRLTDMRTAATTAVATDILARPDASVLGIFGTGRQAAAHVAVVPQVRPFRRILVSGRTIDQSRAFADRMRTVHGREVEAVDLATCMTDSDVICTCTSSLEPLFPGDLVKPGTHLNLIGTFQPHAREVDSVTMQRARVFVDVYEAAFTEAGEILIPLYSGEISSEHVRGDLHELVSTKKTGRTCAEDITIFKSVGCGLEDLVAAKLVLQGLGARSGHESDRK